MRVGVALVQNPSSSIPRVAENAHQAKGVYRLLSNPQVKHDDILSGHVDRTVERCLGRSAVLVIQDTTTLSYTEHRGTRGLGPVNDSARARGFLAHTALAVSVEDHEIEDSLEKAEEKPTTVAPTGPRYARTLALAGTLHSGYRDVASDKYKHLAEIYADKHEKAR